MQLERNCLKKELTVPLAGLFTTGVLLASIGGAIAYLGSPLPWAIMESSQTVESPGSPPVWDAPARTVAFVRSTEKAPGHTATATVVSPSGEVVILDDWQYTAIVRGRPQPSPTK
jgi:hypothetical protein